jgi:hypothetical protein
MLLLIYYRAQLNASLNVKIINLPIKSWEDLAKSDFNVLIYKEAYGESFFKDADSGEVLRQIYDNQIAPLPTEQHINGLGYFGAISKILDGSSVIVGELEVYELAGEYPCQIIDVKPLQYASKHIDVFRYISKIFFCFLEPTFILRILFKRTVHFLNL